jgi:hypothetical protein
MENGTDLNTPFTYKEWVKYKDTLESTDSSQTYPEYLSNWYTSKKKAVEERKHSLREDYVQLLKDMSFVFGKNKSDIFLSEIDYRSDEDLIYSIPFFVRKLKEIAKVLSYKRELVKNSKQKYSLIGSKGGLQTLLYEYVLKGFTKDENYISQVPISLLSNNLPILSSVNDTFFIEVEELHDSQSYHDSDPLVSVEDYVNVAALENEIPFEGFSEEQILKLISTRYMHRIAETPLSRMFSNFLSEIPTLSTVSLFDTKRKNIYNQIEANKKYLGENVYGLTAIRLNELSNDADYILNLNIEQGNNWFYWPSGDKVTNTNYNNIFFPININDSNFVNSGATGGDDYTNSDLFFSDKVGLVEGAWLQGPRIEKSKGTMKATFMSASDREFIFPYIGFDIKTKGTRWGGYNIDDNDYKLYQSLPVEQQTVLLKEYFTNTLPNSASVPLYINDSTLIYNGAHAALFSDDADILTKRETTDYNNIIYNDNNGSTETCYLYEFKKTDIPISAGSNTILWPIQRVGESSSIPITVLNDTCLPVKLNSINISNSMLGAVAGLEPITSDIIYKLNTRNDEATEAAWLGSGSISRLSLDSNINVYDEIAKYCASYNDGPIQPSLNFRVNPKGKVSFIWMGPDTFADEILSYKEHAEDCPYLKTSPHNYYSNQDYINETPINDLQAWKKCRCKAINYSPIGHKGQKCTDYNRMSDFLFADPQGLGENFSFNSWMDTRGLNVLESPQFSFFKLDGQVGDQTVGWGSGKWVTSKGKRMVLKTGRKYTYFRSSLRSDLISGEDNAVPANNSPFLIVSYKYSKIKGNTSISNRDVIILMDKSFSQRPSFANMIKVVDEIIGDLLNGSSSTQIGIAAFDDKILDFNYLTSSVPQLRIFLDRLSSSNRPKNIFNALSFAKYLLTTNINTDIDLTTNSIGELFELCSSLEEKISLVSNNEIKRNYPNPNNKKTIILLSDGYENLDIGKGIPYAKNLIRQGYEIFALDIGPNSSYLDFMEQLTLSDNYYNVQRFLKETDYDSAAFSTYFTSRFTTDLALLPTWYKMIKSIDGRWVPTSIPTDMVLDPGDYITYLHRDHAEFTDQTGTFQTPSISFAFNVDLYGWDYYNNTFNKNLAGLYTGAKPFWAKVYTSPEEYYDQHFDKQTMEFGGQVRFFDGYLPIHQPEISDLVLNNGDFIRYGRRLNEKLIWNQPLSFNVHLSSYEWKKLEFFKAASNLKDLFKTNNPLDLISHSTNIKSDIILEGNSSFVKSKYNYFAKNSFNYSENLYLNSRCYTSFAVLNSALEIEPIAPYKNLTNVHYPTIATVSFPSLAVTEREVGSYMLPEKLGVPYWRGRGYEINIDTENLVEFDALSAERMFLDPKKYSNRHRGLTKRDQRFPLIVSNIDNRWMFKAYRFSGNSGMINDTLNSQKFTPYQSKFEITKINDVGISRIYDDFDFWNIPPLIGNWDSPEQYPLTFRKELTIKSYESRKNLLLTNRGDVTEWKTDIFGNNYGLYKKSTPNLTISVEEQIQNSKFPESKF